MTYSWQKMRIEEYAAYQGSTGERIVKAGQLYWRRVRPFFYRPLLPFTEHSPDTVCPPTPGFFGGYQYAVSSGQKANSLINLLMYEDVEQYSEAVLDRHKRNQIRSAAKEFYIRPIESAAEFKKEAYPVYLSFYERTHYGHKSERRYRSSFSRWADTIYRFAKVAILGAYRDGHLGAVNISELVGDTLLYSTGFCDSDSLRRHVTSFFLHSVLEAAANCEGVKSVFAGPYKYQGRQGVDRFFFERGCSLVQKPAMVRLNPVTMALVRCFLPHEHRKLNGRIETAVSESMIAR